MEESISLFQPYEYVFHNISELWSPFQWWWIDSAIYTFPADDKPLTVSNKVSTEPRGR